jgi:hypothetical protein
MTRPEMRFLVSQIFHDGSLASSTKDFEAGNANPVDKSFVAWLLNLGEENSSGRLLHNRTFDTRKGVLE